MNCMSKSFLITGGSGFIGRSIVEALVKKGENVKILDNESRGELKNLGKLSREIEFFKADIRDKEKVIKAASGVDTVIHLAYINGTQSFYDKPDLVLDVAVKGIANILDASVEKGVSEFFFASSSEVYGEPLVLPTPENVPLTIPDPYNPRYSYSGGKIIGELMTINSSRHFRKTVIFRPHNVYGPAMGYDHVIPQFLTRIMELKNKKNKEFKIQGNGNQSRSFIYITDFTKAFTLILKKSKNLQTYNIGTSQEITISELVKICSQVMDYDVKINRGLLSVGSPQRRCPDISKIVNLGFTPEINLEEGIKKTAEWYMRA